MDEPIPTPEPTPAIQPKVLRSKTLADGDIREIHLAMEAAKGDVVKAAAALRITVPQLHNKLRIKELAIRWKKGKTSPRAPGPDSDIHREPIPFNSTVGPSKVYSAKEIAEMIRKEDEITRTGIQRLGFSGKALDEAFALQQFHRSQFKTVIDLLGGGMTKQFIKMMADITDIKAIIASQDCEPEELEMYVKYHLGLLDCMIRMYDRAVNASLVGAKVAQLRVKTTKEKGGDNNPQKAKPGFGALKSVDIPPQEVVHGPTPT